MMAKIGWLFKRYDDDDNWTFTTEEPPSWVSQVKQIVYFEVAKP